MVKKKNFVTISSGLDMCPDVLLPNFPNSIGHLVQLAEHGQWSNSLLMSNTYSKRSLTWTNMKGNKLFYHSHWYDKLFNNWFYFILLISKKFHRFRKLLVVLIRKENWRKVTTKRLKGQKEKKWSDFTQLAISNKNWRKVPCDVSEDTLVPFFPYSPNECIKTKSPWLPQCLAWRQRFP